MDISKEYIKMCEGAEEIQELWEPKIGDWIPKNPIWHYDVDMINTISNKQFLPVWLPRQDQLQEMVNNLDKWANRPLRLIEDFAEFLYGFKNEWEYSLEQLWLAFVMKEKYNKIWNRENWVTAGG